MRSPWSWLSFTRAGRLVCAGAVLLGTGCSSGSAPPPTDCLAPWRATAQPSLAPVVDALERGQVVILGEHHGDPAQVGLLQEVVVAARARGLAVDVAMELLPRRGQDQLAALHADWSPAGWWQLVGARYHPEPLQLQAYGDAVQGMIAAGAAVHALAPDCEPADTSPASLEAAVACFERRDAAMAEALVALRAPGRALLVSAGLWHGARARPEGIDSLALLLEERLQEDVLQVVIAGVEGPDPAGPAGPPGTCAGLARALQTDHPWTARLDAAPWQGLPGSCLGDGAALSPQLAGLFEVLVIPQAPPAGVPAMLPPAAWAAVPKERLVAWDRLQTQLMGRAALGPSPELWSRQLTESGIRRAVSAARPQDSCHVLRRLGLAANTGRR